MEIAKERVDSFASRVAAQQELQATEAAVAEFRSLANRVAAVEPIAPPSSPPKSSHLDALTGTKKSLTEEFAVEGSLKAQVQAKHAQIAANNKRRLQVIIGMIAVPVVLVLIIVAALV